MNGWSREIDKEHVLLRTKPLGRIGAWASLLGRQEVHVRRRELSQE